MAFSFICAFCSACLASIFFTLCSLATFNSSISCSCSWLRLYRLFSLIWSSLWKLLAVAFKLSICSASSAFLFSSSCTWFSMASLPSICSSRLWIALVLSSACLTSWAFWFFNCSVISSSSFTLDWKSVARMSPRFSGMPNDMFIEDSFNLSFVLDCSSFTISCNCCISILRSSFKVLSIFISFFMKVSPISRSWFCVVSASSLDFNSFSLSPRSEFSLSSFRVFDFSSSSSTKIVLSCIVSVAFWCSFCSLSLVISSVNFCSSIARSSRECRSCLATSSDWRMFCTSLFFLSSSFLSESRSARSWSSSSFVAGKFKCN